jgi:hypothetical protein
VPSPSGTRAVFASDWGNGGTVDTYVAELPSYRPFSASVSTDRASYRKGQTLSLALNLVNPGAPARADLYLLGIRPDGKNLVAFTNAGAVPGLVSAPAGWSPLASNLDLQAPFTLSRTPFLEFPWSGAEPPGTYRFLLLLVERGALTDGSLSEGDLWASAVATVSFTP